jgi:hypothetical protein
MGACIDADGPSLGACSRKRSCDDRAAFVDRHVDRVPDVQTRQFPERSIEYQSLRIADLRDFLEHCHVHKTMYYIKYRIAGWEWRSISLSRFSLNFRPGAPESVDTAISIVSPQLRR